MGRGERIQRVQTNAYSTAGARISSIDDSDEAERELACGSETKDKEKVPPTLNGEGTWSDRAVIESENERTKLKNKKSRGQKNCACLRRSPDPESNEGLPDYAGIERVRAAGAHLVHRVHFWGVCS
jgi:hypothetical protein